MHLNQLNLSIVKYNIEIKIKSEYYKLTMVYLFTFHHRQEWFYYPCLHKIVLKTCTQTALHISVRYTPSTLS